MFQNLINIFEKKIHNLKTLKVEFTHENIPVGFKNRLDTAGSFDVLNTAGTKY